MTDCPEHDVEVLGGPERPSVVAEARASDAVDTLMVASHLDTVPVDGMEIDPFDPVIRDDRLYGRGSCDTKSGMAALLEALERVLQRGTLRRRIGARSLESRGDFVVASTPDPKEAAR